MGDMADMLLQNMGIGGADEGRKPLNDTEKRILELYNSGMTVQKDIADTIGKHKSAVSRAMARIREEFPELINEPDSTEQEQEQAAGPEPEQEESGEQAEPAENGDSGADTAPKKAVKKVFGFKTEQKHIDRWRLYAEATQQEIGVMCTEAIESWIDKMQLTEEQKELLNIKERLTSKSVK